MSNDKELDNDIEEPLKNVDEISDRIVDNINRIVDKNQFKSDPPGTPLSETVGRMGLGKKAKPVSAVVEMLEKQKAKEIDKPSWLKASFYPITVFMLSYIVCYLVFGLDFGRFVIWTMTVGIIILIWATLRND